MTRFVTLISLTLFCSQVTGANLQSQTTQASVPAMRTWQDYAGTLAVKHGTRIVITPADYQALQGDALLFQADIKAITATTPRIVKSDRVMAGDVQLLLTSDPDLGNYEAYRLEIDNHITIRARSSAGVFYGMQTLLQRLKLAADHTMLQRGTGTDAPDFAVRAVMLDVGRRFYEVTQIENFLRDMAWKKLNTLHLHLSDWSAFRLHSGKYPGLAAAQAYSRTDMRRIQNTAARYHITIVPEIELPAHAAALTAYKPELAFNCPSMRHSPWLEKEGIDPRDKAWTVDITKPENRQWLHDLYEEFIPWFDGPYFHVGSDEYQYDADKWQCPELLAAMHRDGHQYPGDLFVDWINEVNRQVKTHGKRTIMWNWWQFGDNKTSIQPDKDIIIDVWNAEEQQKILSEGYKVILSPEELLFVSPGLENAGGVAGYGIVDIENIYQQWKPERAASVLGYSVAVWADNAELHTDQWFFGKAYEPISVLAEKLWSGNPSESAADFLARLNRVGLPPSNDLKISP